ncbi:hypothetical protein HYU94_00640, partial [Candidatus Daviesbacteria bacterium]|nr:hypothetical protein [Candidatus Daviesbacteria bacterium]
QTQATFTNVSLTTNYFLGTSGLMGNLSNLSSYSLNTTYYARLWNGAIHSATTPFFLPLCPSGILPWIQVTGDVHSNTGINTPGGPP